MIKVISELIGAKFVFLTNGVEITGEPFVKIK